MSSVASNSTTREVLDRLIMMDEPVGSMFHAAREAFIAFDREGNGRHHGGNMDYLRGAWHQAVRSLLIAGQIKDPSLEADLLAFAQELREHFTRK